MMAYSLVLIVAGGLIFILQLILLGTIIQIGISKRRNSTFAIGLKRFIITGIFHYLILKVIHSNPEISMINYLWPVYYYVIPISLIYWYINHNIKWKGKHRNIASFDKLHNI